MDFSSIVAQLISFTTTLVQIVKLLETNSSVVADIYEDSELENKQKLHDSKFEIFEAVLALNSFILSSHGNVSAFPGSLVLAPRFYEGNMCMDFAIVTLIKCCNLDSQSYISQERHDARVSETESDTFIKNSNQTIKVIWLRPRSRYELFSHSISFSESQLDFENVSKIVHDQELRIKSLSVGDKVLYISLLNDARYGTWKKGIVQKIVKDGDYVQIEHEIKDSAANTSIGSVLLPLKITFVAPLPRKMLSNTISNHIDIKLVSSKINSLYDDVDQSETGDGDDQDGITALPSIYGAMLAKDSNSSSVAVAGSSYPLGLWERHTKGFGGKILAKMGFRRGQGGLGKQSQGILQPIDVGFTPLPSGLGLDFIHEAKKEKTDHLTEEEASEKRRMKIVQDFNKRNSKAAKVSKKSSAVSSEEPTCVFNFLNSLESKKVQIGGKSKAPSVSTPAAVPAVKLARSSKHVF
eukprot:gene26821-35165_t